MEWSLHPARRPEFAAPHVFALPQQAHAMSLGPCKLLTMSRAQALSAAP